MQESVLHLASNVGDLLAARQWQISCAESCTGGGIAYAITSRAGSSAWFKESYVTYSNEAKQKLLGVKAQTLEQFGAVSEQTVLEMARGCAENSGAKIAIAVSGIAGPDGGSTDKPVGTVWFGFYVAGECNAEHCIFPGDRHQVREASVQFALEKVLQILNNQ